MSVLRLLQLAVILCALAPSAAVAAAPIVYTGSVAVRSQDEAERADALRSALAKVVIERSGDAGILAREDVANAVAKADRYVVQYSYHAEAGAAPLMLVAQFDAAAVDALLQRLGLRASTPLAGGDSASEVSVWIGGLRGVDDWLRVAGYLARQPRLRASRPLAAHDDGVLMRLSLDGGLAPFLDTLAAGQVLAVDAGAAPSGADAALVLVP